MILRAKQMTTSEAFITMFEDLMLYKRTAMPGFITAVNIVNGGLASVDVQPAISHVVTNPDGITTRPQVLPVVSGVPVVMPRSQTKGLSLTIPVSVGDEALLVFADRSLDNWQTTGKVSTPYEPVFPRTHALNDAIAVVGLFNDMTPVTNYALDAIEMRNKSNTVSVSVTDNVVSIKNGSITTTINGSEIEMVNGSSSIKIESSKITLNSPLVEITGASLEMGSSSNVTTGGGLSSSGGLDFDNHKHSDPQGGFTGPPQN